MIARDSEFQQESEAQHLNQRLEDCFFFWIKLRTTLKMSCRHDSVFCFILVSEECPTTTTTIGTVFSS